MNLTRFVPGLRVVTTYQRSWLPRDLVAGVVLATLLVLGVGAGWAFTLDAATFVVSALFLLQMRPRVRGEAPAATESVLDAATYQRCSAVGEELLKRGFDGDFERLLAWWRQEKPRFARTETASALH